MKSFRIGNCLNYATGEGIFPTLIEWEDLKWMEEDSDDFFLRHSSIPVTDFWLHRIGFTRSELTGNYHSPVFANDRDYELMVDIKQEQQPKIYIVHKTSATGEWKTFELPVIGDEGLKVHDLQNIYYDLSKMPLPVKIRDIEPITEF